MTLTPAVVVELQPTPHLCPAKTALFIAAESSVTPSPTAPKSFTFLKNGEELLSA
jgi:hypothetical protein